MKYLLTVICVLALVSFGFAGEEEGHDGHGHDADSHSGEEAKGHDNDTDAPWFDMAGCGFCKHLTAEEGFLENVSWENFVIPTGMMTVTGVPAEYKEAHVRINAKMEAIGKEMQAGKMVPMCGMCSSMGELFMSGQAEYKTYQIKGGEVALFTSGDPEVIKKIQAHAQRTIDEYAKMEAAEAK